MTVQIRVKDNGARRLVTNLRVAKRDRRVLDVGIIGEEAGELDEGGTDKTVGEIAAIHEFGLGVIPRPFLRGYVDANRPKIDARIREEAIGMVRFGRSKVQAYERLGVWLQGQIQEWLGNPGNSLEPNAPSTIIKKGSAMPLIDTGQLRSSITHKIRREGEG